MVHTPLIDQVFLEKLERLTIHWQRSFSGLIGGHNISHFPGAGQEFLDHRNFHHGDDLRAINWRAYLRLEKLFLKMFQVEPRIPVRLLLDTSASMTVGATDKFAYAKRLAAALTYIGLVRLDTICIQPFRDGLSESFVCSGGRHRISPAVDFLVKQKSEGKTGFLTVARQFLADYPQRGLIIVISDFLDDNDPERPLQYLADFGNELLLIHLWAPEDREPPWDGDVELVDSETGTQLQLAVDGDTRSSYTAAFDAFSRRLQNMAHRSGGRYAGLPTTLPIEEAIFGPLLRTGGLQ